MRAKALGLVAVVALAALLPLYGDTRPGAAVAHPEWARMVLRGLGLLSDAPGVNDTAAQAFASLSGRDSRSFPGAQYVRGARVEPAAPPAIRAVGGIGEAVYAVGVARGGDYRLRLHVDTTGPGEAEISRAGEAAVLRSFPVPPSPGRGWVDAGTVHLDPGAYDTAVLLPEGATLEYVELAPPCLHPIEPRGGWKAGAVTTTEDVAVTVLQALDLESELPPAATPLELRGSELVREDGTPTPAPGAEDPGALRAGPRGTRAVLEVNVPEDGLYTLSAFGDPRGGHRWVLDGCRKAVVCPSPDPTPRWRVVLSAILQKGPHTFSVVLGPDVVVERLRLEAKKDAPEDYAASLARLGLDLGAPGPVSRELADEARRFLEGRRVALDTELCGDILEPGTLVAEAAPGAGGEGGGGPGAGGPGGGGGGGGVPPPILPPLPPASPTLPVGFGAGR